MHVTGHATWGKHIWCYARGHLLSCLILAFAFFWRCLFNATSGAQTGGEASKICSVSSRKTGPDSTVFYALSGKSLTRDWSGDGKVTEPWDPPTCLQTDTRLWCGIATQPFPTPVAVSSCSISLWSITVCGTEGDEVIQLSVSKELPVGWPQPPILERTSSSWVQKHLYIYSISIILEFF